MKKKFLSVVLSVAMAATLLVGCGSTAVIHRHLQQKRVQTQQQKRVQTQQQKEQMLQMHRQKKVPILQTTKLLW